MLFAALVVTQASVPLFGDWSHSYPLVIQCLPAELLKCLLSAFFLYKQARREHLSLATTFRGGGNVLQSALVALIGFLAQLTCLWGFPELSSTVSTSMLWLQLPLTSHMHAIMYSNKQHRARAAAWILCAAAIAFTFATQTEHTSAIPVLAILCSLYCVCLFAADSILRDALFQSAPAFWKIEFHINCFGLILSILSQLLPGGSRAVTQRSAATYALCNVCLALGSLFRDQVFHKGGIQSSIQALPLIAITTPFLGMFKSSNLDALQPLAILTAGSVLICSWAYREAQSSDVQLVLHTGGVHTDGEKSVSALQNGLYIQLPPHQNDSHPTTQTNDYFRLPPLSRSSLTITALLVVWLSSLTSRRTLLPPIAARSAYPQYSRSALSPLPSIHPNPNWSTATLIRHLFASAEVQPAAPSPLPWNPIMPTGDTAILKQRSLQLVTPERVCVMSSDTRPLQTFQRPNNYYNAADRKSPFDLPPQTATLYYNAIWAMRHGYRYIRAPGRTAEDYHPTWAKLNGLLSVIQNPKCDLTVFFDGDAYVTDPAIPLDRLLQRWGFHDNIQVLWSADPNGNLTHANTGFGVFRNSERAAQLIRDLINCPTDIAECQHWTKDLYNEQSAWNEFIRDKLDYGEEYLLASCYDSDGYWGFPDPEKPWDWNEWPGHLCRGALISHPWWNKGDVARWTAETLTSELLALVATQFDPKTGEFAM